MDRHALEQEDGLVLSCSKAIAKQACSGQSTRGQEWSKKAGLLPSFGHQILVKRSMIGTEAACHIKISFFSVILTLRCANVIGCAYFLGYVAE